MERVQLLSIVVTGAGDFKNTIELEKKFNSMTGVFVPENAAYAHDVLIKTFSSDGDTNAFESGVALKVITANNSVAPDAKFKTFKKPFPAEGKKLIIEVTDDGAAVAYPYTIPVHVRLEI